MKTLRYNPPSEWTGDSSNHLFLGFCDMLSYVNSYFKSRNDLKMIEIGSYMGESSSLFASSGMFKEIHCIEPFHQNEDANDDLGYTWDDKKKEFETNTRMFDNIILHEDFSFNVEHKFKDGTFDFVYVDGEHDYESVERDIKLYLPKLKPLSLFGGHDYHVGFQVIEAVNNLFGKPDDIFGDTSWIKKVGV
tara:strand:- start:114 stop:686 length:573 start_codon:yes stop_codon:yes gene_type:complete